MKKFQNGYLANIRTTNYLTQRELAEEAGVSPSALSRIEAGTSKPRLSTLRKLAAALDVHPDSFFLHPKKEAQA